MIPLREVYGRRDVDRVAKEMAWLGTLTSPVRDLDVFAEVVTRYQRGLSQDTRTELDPFERLLAARRKSAVRELVSQMESKRYRTLLKSWKRFAKDAQPVDKLDRRSAKKAAREWTWARYGKVRKRLAAVHSGAEPAALHEARIEMKKLRYLIEFFGSLFPAADVAKVLGLLKEAQDALGILNDLSVHRAMIRGMAQVAEQTHLLPSSTLIAMGELSMSLELEKRRLTADVDELIAPFLKKSSTRRFKRLYKP